MTERFPERNPEPAHDLLALGVWLALAAAALQLFQAWDSWRQTDIAGLDLLAMAIAQVGFACVLHDARMRPARAARLALGGVLLNVLCLLVWIAGRLVVNIPVDESLPHTHGTGAVPPNLVEAHLLLAQCLLVWLLGQLHAVLQPSARTRRAGPSWSAAPALLLLLALSACVSSSDLDQLTPTPDATAGPTAQPTAHETSEGLPLGSDDKESVYAGARCPATAKVRAYDVVAINVEITLNRYLDYDPEGRMYVLAEDLNRARQEEAQNRAARAGKAEPAVSIGLQGDAIQPLTLRVNQGECLRITLANQLKDGEPASLHLHGSSLHMVQTGAPAIATNPDAIVPANASATYEWMVSADEPEGTHYFHSHGDDRNQTNHGLFGALVVERAGSSWLDPLHGGELRSGWSAIVKPPSGSAFREFAFFYHEIGNERFRPLDKDGRLVPQVDPYTDAYRPLGRAMNYRSEAFMNRLALQQSTFQFYDKSQAYSSYVFGDPATPIARSYLGDPVKQRVIHGGSEVFHVHHVHGGAIRWLRQPGEEPTHFDSGLDKHPPLVPDASERTDSQSIGPSETYDIEDECGSGGCQQSAGDYLVHCHVAHHYLAGMWAIWRVYDTLQDGNVSQDTLPALNELPDRTGRMKPAVTSDALIGKRVDWMGKSFQITQDNFAEWVERQLPPRGVPIGYDASVFDWQRTGDLYVGEAETDKQWPGYRSAHSGERLPFYFDPLTGKLAYPFLRPHLGKRPPFAPNHGPAPFLEPIHQGTAVAQPGENGPWSLCPAGTQIKSLNIDAIELPISLNKKLNILDPNGRLYVLRDQADAVRADDKLKTPLAIRANAGEDCVDVVLKNEMPDERENGFFSKVDVHIHFVQFDVQASDGVNTGFNYEQSVRPFSVEGERLSAAASAGANTLRLSSTKRFQPGAVVGVGMAQDQTFEVRRIQAVSADGLTFDEPLRFAHAQNEIVSAEFVRYRWYPDAQFGTAYFHDHVDALHSWRHGLFGALIVEPPRSTYHDPHTGAELKSGTIADIHTSGKVSADIGGSFRELVAFIQDDNPLTRVGNSSGSSLNLRVEPLWVRRGDPAQLFSSKLYGDPETPILESFAGDPLVLRTLVGGTNDVHTLHVDGHWFRQELFSSTSAPISTIHLGISERYDLAIPQAGGPQHAAGDYLFYDGRQFKLREGSWGLLRVYDPAQDVALQKLPGRDTPAPAAPGVCPDSAPLKEYALAAVDVPLPMLAQAKLSGTIYVLQADKSAVLNGSKKPEPLVLHVNVGDCIRVHLANETRGGAVSLHADLLAFDPKDSYGVAAGNDPIQVAKPGETRDYTFFASPEVGETTALLMDGGSPLLNPRAGLYGAIVVGPRGATYSDPLSGADLALKASWRADVHPAGGSAYRDFTLFMQDEDEVIGTAIMPYSEHVAGVVGLNYQAERLDARLAKNDDTSEVFRSDIHGDPSTPLLEAYAGDRVKVHVLVPYSEQAHVFTLEDHQWPLEPARAGSDLRRSLQAGALDAITIALDSAGGPGRLPGDYLYGDHREPFREAGLWGLFRVYAPRTPVASLRPLAP